MASAFLNGAVLNNCEPKRVCKIPVSGGLDVEEEVIDLDGDFTGLL
jgi:hypothetical protein